MKQSMAILSAAAVVAMAQPKFLNSNFDITPGEKFQLKYEGCEEGCDIVLVNGDSKQLKDVQTLVKGASGESSEITLSDSFPKDTYALKLVPNDGSKPNYSIQFEFEGSGEAPAESETSSAAESTSASETATETETETESSTVEETSTVTSSVAEETTTVTKATPTPEPSSTEAETSTSTSEESEPTETDSEDGDAPDSGASSLAASGATLFAAAAGLFAYIL